MNESPVRTGYRVIGGQFLVYDANLLDDVVPELFEMDYWRSQHAVLDQAPGRGTTFFLRHAMGEWALRRYMRGGGMGKLFRDGYLWTGLTATRAWREWHLLMQLHNQGLPVSVPVAARIVKRGLVYRADLMTRRIEHARSWQECMLEGALPGESWVRLGGLLRRFHNAGVYHHDLTIRNILCAANSDLYLIDFDQARIRRPGRWQRANLSRLLRSIRKLERQGMDLHFSDDSWGQLLQGYLSAA